MTFAMGLLQIFDGQLGVVFQSFQILMPQEFFYVVEIGAAPNRISSVVQLRRKVCGVTWIPNPAALACRCTIRRNV